MDIDEILKRWLPLIGSTLFICLLSTLPLPEFFLIPFLVAIIYAMQEQVFYTRTLAKSFWLTTYLRKDSPIRELLVGSSLVRWIAVAISIPLACITYVSVYSYDLWDCIAVAIGVYCARLVHQNISTPMDDNVAEQLIELAHVRVYNWFAVFFVLLALASAAVAKGAFSDLSNATSDQLATYTIDSVKHPVKLVQHCVRTLRYSELQLLRVRDINGWPYGWLIYFFLLIPNALPAYGVVTLYSGSERLAKAWIKNA